MVKLEKNIPYITNGETMNNVTNLNDWKKKNGEKSAKDIFQEARDKNQRNQERILKERKKDNDQVLRNEGLKNWWY